MVYINTTGKHNEVWLDKPYAVVCSDCPSTEDAYNSGYTSGRTDGYDDGWGPGYDSGYTDGLEACSGETIHNQTKFFNIGTGSQDELKVQYLDGTYFFQNASLSEYIRPDSGYTGLEQVGLFLYIWAGEAVQDGENQQKAKLVATAFTQNGTYTRADGWSSVTINISGYTQEDLDAAFASGYSAGLRDCSGYTPVSGDSVLDFVYETTEPNQTINLAVGTASDNGKFLKYFYSAITRFEVDGVEVQKSENNIRFDSRNTGYAEYFIYTFSTHGRHNVKFYLTPDVNDGTYYQPAKRLDDLLFMGNSSAYVPLVEARIGEGVEVIAGGAFENENLTAVTIPNTVTYLETYAFANSGLKSVVIPDSVVEIDTHYHQTSWTGVFGKCSGLTDVIIGTGVTAITRAFHDCPSITAMTFEGLTPPTLYSTEPLGSTAYTFPIYVPASAVSTYQNEPSWVDYASRVQAKP